MVQQGEFREDLLFRLKAFSLEVPPLRAHREDIKELVLYYVAKLCRNYGIAEKNVSPEVFDILTQYHWPGNVRELVHTLERAISAAPDDPVLFQKNTSPRLSASLWRGLPSAAEQRTKIRAGRPILLQLPFRDYRGFENLPLLKPNNNTWKICCL